MTPARLSEIIARVREGRDMAEGPRRRRLLSLVVRQDVPDLLARIYELEAEVERLVDELPEATDEDCARAAGLAAEHLRAVRTDRGLARMPRLQGGDCTVRAAESSLADGPHVWLFTAHDEDTALHLPADVARKLGEQLIWLADNHYQLAPALSVTEPEEGGGRAS